MAFKLSGSTRFERDFEKLAKKNREVLDYARLGREILATDPYNISRRYHIKKLTDVTAGEGQWRLTIGRYRLRYDITGNAVELHSFKPRPEAYR